MSAPDQEPTHYTRTYVKVFAALMVLTIGTVAVSYAELSVPIAIVVAIAIASLKGSLVASFFMHLVHERPVVFGALVLTAVLLVALLALPILTASDSIARPYTLQTAVPTTQHMER